MQVGWGERSHKRAMEAEAWTWRLQDIGEWEIIYMMHYRFLARWKSGFSMGLLCLLCEYLLLLTDCLLSLLLQTPSLMWLGQTVAIALAHILHTNSNPWWGYSLTKSLFISKFMDRLFLVLGYVFLESIAEGMGMEYHNWSGLYHMPRS